MTKDKTSTIDFTASTPLFTSDGTLTSVKNAEVAAQNGNLAISKHFKHPSDDSKNFVLIGTLKNLPNLIKKEKIKKLKKINSKICMTYSGLSPDFQRILNYAYNLAEEYYKVYDKEMGVSRFVKEISMKMQQLTNQSSLRPFGLKLIVAGTNEEAQSSNSFKINDLHYFHLSENVEKIENYEISENGSFQKKSDIGIGKFGPKSVEFLSKRTFKEIESASIEVFKCMREFSDNELRVNDFEICCVNENGVEIFGEENIKDLLNSF